ncbi:hypothetical protein EVAR_36402_1 [Eumeta japonica]|uniref:Uncharacterized protein n=1 Tax=Eumeta variegata TaxID=151549 RepID=A0A4C1VNG7_EUMVA|nr:hypothetical protein EVAR_36402_1 [Eumeta japonica]
MVLYVYRNAWTEVMCGGGAGSRGDDESDTPVCARAHQNCRFAKLPLARSPSKTYNELLRLLYIDRVSFHPVAVHALVLSQVPRAIPKSGPVSDFNPAHSYDYDSNVVCLSFILPVPPSILIALPIILYNYRIQ